MSFRRMSVFRTTRQNGITVIRDEKNRVVSKVIDPPTNKPLAKLLSWRKLLRDLDTTGIDDWLQLRAIAYGEPRKVYNPDDGTYTYDVPSISDQRQALTTLLEMRFGKAVAQTEVMKAETEAEEAKQYAAISDEELLKAIKPLYLERVEKKAEDDDSVDS